MRRHFAAKRTTIRSAVLTPFGQWLYRHELNYADAARALGVTRQTTFYWGTGHATPSLKRALALEEWTRTVDPDDFVATKSWANWIAPRRTKRPSYS